MALIRPACPARRCAAASVTAPGWTGGGALLRHLGRTPAAIEAARGSRIAGRRALHRSPDGGSPIGLEDDTSSQSAVGGVMDLIVSPDGAVAYLYRPDASQLYVIKGLK